MAPSPSKARRASSTGQLPREIKATRRGQPHLARARRGDAQREGAARSLPRLVNNMVKGVAPASPRTSKSKASASRRRCKGQILNLNLGFSHPILFPIPEGIKITVTENTKINVEGIDKTARRPGRGRHPPLLPAGALQGQGRALRRRRDPAQGRQNRPVVMKADRKHHPRSHSQADPEDGQRHGGASAARGAFFRQACLRAGHRRRSGQDARRGRTRRKKASRRRARARIVATAEKVGKAVAERLLGEEGRQGGLRSRRLSSITAK